MKCCMCGRMCEDEYGNNPAPLVDEGRCCNECNLLVIEYRITLNKIVSLLKKDILGKLKKEED